MISVRSLIYTFALVASALGHPGQYPKADSVQPRQQASFYSKYWANDKAELDWDDLDGGKFAVSWDQPNGGNFVVGKGYKPGREL